MSTGSVHPAPKVQAFFESIALRYDLTNRLMSGGCDILWRKKVARMVARWQPQLILDLATGSGDLALALRRSCPGGLIVGADFSPPMLREARRKGLQNLTAGDGIALPFAAETFEAVTVAFGLRNMPSWQAALAEMRRVLQPTGRLVIMDFSMPCAPLRWLYRPYLRKVLPIIAGLITKERAIYDYFVDSIERFPSGEEMKDLMASAGLHCEEQVDVFGGIVAIHVATKMLMADSPA